MISAYIFSTGYDQPKPVDGEYVAKIFESHAEFNYAGRKVIAKSVKGCMAAGGVSGKVLVTGFSANIVCDFDVPRKEFQCSRSNDRKISYEKVLVATLVPTGFDQPYPFYGGKIEYKSRIRKAEVEFGCFEKYRAVLDSNVQFAVLDAPCTILPFYDDPMRCRVIFDDATIYLARKYGQGVHDKLVADAVNELQQLLAIT